MKSGSRPKRREAERKDAAGHVAYEVAMLCFIADNYPSIIGSPAEQESQNMALESFLVHYRNIRDFLFPTKSVRCPSNKTRSYAQDLDTVVALDFTTKWQKGAVDWDKRARGERKRINKRLAHISYSRSRLSSRWDLPEMKGKLMKEFQNFLKKLENSRRRRKYFSKPNTVPRGH